MTLTCKPNSFKIGKKMQIQTTLSFRRHGQQGRIAWMMIERRQHILSIAHVTELRSFFFLPGGGEEAPAPCGSLASRECQPRCFAGAAESGRGIRTELLDISRDDSEKPSTNQDCCNSRIGW